jgi:hypothetical protein
MDLHERMITRFTIDANKTAMPGDRIYNPRLVVHIQRFGIHTERWYICQGHGGEMVYNHHAGGWDTDYELRHTDDKTHYLTSLEEAVQRVGVVIEQLSLI